MEQSMAQRRLVKSPPELWAEVSSEPILRRHLAEFGEIRITHVDPETTVAWEGDRASGTVELAPAGWGTKVVLTATPVSRAPAVQPAAAEPEPEPVAVAPEPEPAVEFDPAPEPARDPTAVVPTPAAGPPRAAPAGRVRRGMFARLFRRRAPAPAAEIPAPGPPVHDPSPPAPAPDPTPPGPGPDPTPPPPPPDPVPPAPAPDPTPPPSIQAGEPPAALGPERTVAILTEFLDDLGAAHRRIVLHD
jgi:hypothetical protein